MSVGDRGWCSKCKTDVREAWVRFRPPFGTVDNSTGRDILRCECWPVKPTLARHQGRAQTVVLGGQYPEPPDYPAVDSMFR